VGRELPVPTSQRLVWGLPNAATEYWFVRALPLPCFLLMSILGGAQTPSNAGPSSGPAPASADPITFGPLIFTGSIRSRLYAWDWFEPVTGENQYQFSANILRLNFAEKLRSWDWDAEFAVPFQLGLPTMASLPAPQGALGLGSNFYSANGSNRNVGLLYPKQLFARLGKGGDEGQTLQLGRFVFADGGETVPKNATLAAVKSSRILQRLLGDFGFTEPGRAFDGLHYSFSRASDNFTVVAAVPTRGVFQVDGWGWIHVGFGYGAYTHDWGKGRHAADTRFFMLEYDDWREVLKTDNRPLAVRRGDTGNIRIDTFGGHSVHAITTDAGTIDLLAWGAVQTGRWGTQRQRAYAVLFEAGWQPKIPPKLKPWLRVGFREGSGDSNPNDNTHGTFFEVLDTPRQYARTPFFNTMNIQDLYGNLVLRLHAKITASSEYHSLRLASPNDLWYSGGGAYQPWSFGFTGRSASGRRSLANLYDTNLEYRVNRKLTLTGYLGYMQGLASIELIYPKNKNGRFGFLELLCRF
jgi:hypothetical protein